MQDAIHKGYEYFVQYGMNVAAAIIIFVVGHMVSRFVAQLTEKAMASANLSKTLTSFGRHLVFYVAMTFVVIASLNKLGVETTSFIAVLGAASLAVGLALQGSLSNFASGVLIVLFQVFKVGDTIEAAGPSGGAKGRVDEIQIFYTVLTNDGKRTIVPNSKITSDKITIESTS